MALSEHSHQLIKVGDEWLELRRYATRFVIVTTLSAHALVAGEHLIGLTDVTARSNHSAGAYVANAGEPQDIRYFKIDDVPSSAVAEFVQRMT